MKTEAKKKADNKWDAKAYDKITLRIRKDTEPTRETITAAAGAAGMSLNAYIMEAVKEKMNGGSDPPGNIPELEHEPFFDN